MERKKGLTTIRRVVTVNFDDDYLNARLWSALWLLILEMLLLAFVSLKGNW